jgi:ParB-like chromosome segregation protein Spo0J
MKLKEMNVSKLVEHPENIKWFADIRKQSMVLWDNFKDSIKQFGVIEPLIVNENTFKVISGNQRLKACQELNIPKVQCILIDPKKTSIEEAMLVVTNTMRRNDDPFKKYERIKWIKENHVTRRGVKTANSLRSKLDAITQDSRTMKASDIFNALPVEKQDELKEWFYKDNHLIKDLQAKIKEYQHQLDVNDEKVIELEKIIESGKTEIEQRDKLLEELELRYEEKIAEKDEEIEEVKELLKDAEDADVKELQEYIKKLEDSKKRLKIKIEEMKKPPDLTVYLQKCITDVADMNAVLDSILENKAMLSDQRVARLGDLISKTIKIINRYIPKNNKILEVV